MLPADEALRILDTAEEIHSAVVVSAAVKRVAQEINRALADTCPLVLSVMGGAVVFAGQLLPLLTFPLDFDYIHVTRYREGTAGGTIDWKVAPRQNVEGRVVLVVDDILDEGQTLAAVRDRVLEHGARAFYSAVFADKTLDHPKPIRADFVALTVPNRYVFGFGMDVRGAWRNLPAIYALKDH
ncbi:MAG: hypoxanthine-guanine phosphoribosyltransferase [Betaproteobacteria bacterium]|nr:hypoxanthine-guanine phosphoribosyltransferase [Betaproteobacteria bacterium]